jgi:surface protein
MGGMFSFEFHTDTRGAFNQDLCAWGPLLQGRSVVFRDQTFGRNMFTLTSCPSEANPNLEASPSGPFCHICPELTKGLCFQTNEELRAGVDQFFSGNETTVETQYGQIEDWCFSSNVTNMSYLFENRPSFNSNISSWNVQYVTNMQAMFRGASMFNQPLARWNVSNVINLSLMFYCYPQENCIFDQPLDAWDVSKVTNMNRMFAFNPVFNQPLESWDVSSVTDMGSTFAYAYAFDQPLGSWNVSSVTNMGGTFSFNEERGVFNQDLCAWGPLLQGRSVVFKDPVTGRNMFALTSCPSEANPNLEASPPGPFCHICD